MHLENAEEIVAFEIKDTGIGISKDKQSIIFEAFQQAEGIYQPEIWRNRVGIVYQPWIVGPARWFTGVRKRTRQGKHLYLIPAIKYQCRPGYQQ